MTLPLIEKYRKLFVSLQYFDLLEALLTKIWNYYVYLGKSFAKVCITSSLGNISYRTLHFCILYCIMQLQLFRLPGN